MKYLIPLATCLIINMMQAQASERPIRTGMKTIAHRGYWDTAGSAQNSVAALVKAQELGVYGSEFDVWMTTDGKVVLNHDGVIDGITIENATYEQIKDKTLGNGEKIPSLQDYLDQGKLVPEVKLICEIKTHSTATKNNACVAKVVAEVTAAGMQEQVEYIAFSMEVCKELLRLQPDAQVAYLNGDYTPQAIKDLNLTGIDYNIGVIRSHPEYVAQSHALGLSVNVWTLRTKAEMLEMLKLGVDFITTDNPAEGKNFTAFPVTIAQLCDPQLGFDKGTFAADSLHFEQAVAKINALKPDIVALAGDMVNDVSDEHAIAVFHQIKGKLKVPVIFTPGNHDLPDPVTDAGLDRYRKCFGDDFQTVEIDGITIISANSQLWRKAPEAAIDRQEKQLQAALTSAAKRGHRVIMLTHVPPFVKEVEEKDEYFNLPLAVRKNLLQRFVENGVILWLAGHTHNTHKNDFGPISILNGETTSINFDKRPFGFRLLTVYPDNRFDWEFIPATE
ncbi:MAG: metallophosphoesterase [Dysgonamonadaceae bacterium]|nr:metallophosphoesterase [Dysgonamonadaceae bacterium]